MAPAAGFEPATKWLTATYSTAELCRSKFSCNITYSTAELCRSKFSCNIVCNIKLFLKMSSSISAFFLIYSPFLLFRILCQDFLRFEPIPRTSVPLSANAYEICLLPALFMGRNCHDPGTEFLPIRNSDLPSASLFQKKFPIRFAFRKICSILKNIHKEKGRRIMMTKTDVFKREPSVSCVVLSSLLRLTCAVPA